MRYRELGRTGFTVSEIGYGAWGIGGDMWGRKDDDEALRALHRAIDLGLNFIDTALAYGNGHSERLIGRVLKDRKERIAVATKIPPKNRVWPARDDATLDEVFPYDYIVSCAETSLRNLGVDTIDVLQFHVWNDRWAERGEWQAAVRDLKEVGKVSHFGISMNDHQAWNGLKAARTGLIDSFQVIYNIFDQQPEEELFPLCQELNIGIIVRVPLDEGGLTGKVTPDTVFEPGDWRADYFQGDRKRQVYERVQALGFLLEYSDSIAEAALRFCLSHPAVSTVIPGMRKVRHVDANIAVSDKGPLPTEVLKRLKDHAWPRNFYD
jgi:aryl-alcohol dehydrogenase-like predicted oxidoreductase